ncbi:hypothetical protein [Streptacidiphilus albus]|uniref:hypothetical protein n=1 Tax=Streptacidiphilus albus TaxID=105425 RepID=UPI00054C0CD1|nr:hypothetical protein [Streptacidiphilus albus]
MITFKLNGAGDEITVDEDSLLYAEALELEKQTGMGANKFLVERAAGTTQSTAALLWIGVVKAAAARDGVSFRDAARTLTFAKFTESVDLLASMATSRRVVDAPAAPEGGEDEDPTPGSAESTSPATSEPQPSATPSPDSAPTTSDSSPTTSESAPGSGTSSPSPTSAP